VLTGRGPDGGPLIPVQITLADIQAVARDFILAQADCLVVMNTLHNRLWDNAHALGSDESAKLLATTYDPAAERAFAGFVRIHGLLGAIAVGLSTSAANHAQADAASTVPGHPQVDPIPVLRGDPPISQLDVPEIAGHSPAWLPSQLQPLFPSYDNDKATGVQRAYWDAASGIEDVFAGLRTALRSLLAGNDSADLRAFSEFMGRLDGSEDTLLVAFPHLLRALGDAVQDYVTKVDAAGEDLNHALQQAAEEAGLILGLSIIIDVASRGLTTALTGPELGAMVTVAGRTLAPVAAGVRLAVSGSELILAAGTAAGALTVAMATAPDPNIETTDATHLGDQADPGLNQFGQTEQDLNDLGMDPATSRFRPGEKETAMRIQDQTGVKLTRAPRGKLYDWEGADGKTYDAVGNFPARIFDGQWEHLKEVIVDHLGKADFVPVDVSQFTAEQVAEVQHFVEQYNPRVFLVGR
jgi:hypothetical protein